MGDTGPDIEELEETQPAVIGRMCDEGSEVEEVEGTRSERQTINVLKGFGLALSDPQHVDEDGLAPAACEKHDELVFAGPVPSSGKLLPPGATVESLKAEVEELGCPARLQWDAAVALLTARLPLAPSGRAVFAQLPQGEWLDFIGRSDALGTRCLFASRRHEHSVFMSLEPGELFQVPEAAKEWQPPVDLPPGLPAGPDQSRAEPWAVDVHPGRGVVRVAVRPGVLLRRMLSRGAADAAARFTWRVVDASQAELVDGRSTKNSTALGEFSILTNIEDPAHSQPPQFEVYPLRPEQLRSLGWMASQEKSRADAFCVELRVSLPCPDAPHWRLEGRLWCEYRGVQGGVLADAIGFGKTACTIGLVNCFRGHAAPIPPPKLATRYIPTRATLVLVPTNLHAQWLSEIEKFTGKTMKVLSVPTVSQLKHLTPQMIMEADVVVATYRLFYSHVYLRRLAALARERRQGFEFPKLPGSSLAKTPVAGRRGSGAKLQPGWERAYAEALQLLGGWVAGLQGAGGGLTAAPPSGPATPVRQGRGQGAAAAANGACTAGADTPAGAGKQARPPRGQPKKAARARKAVEGAWISAATQDYLTDMDDAATQVYVESPQIKPKLNGKQQSVTSKTRRKASKHVVEVLDAPEEPQKRRRVSGKQAAAEQAAEVGASQSHRMPLAPWWQSNTRFVPLEAFWWQRVVCDEFHELISRYPPSQTAIELIRADYKWGLSGTPPCATLAQIRKVAGFFGVQFPGEVTDGGDAPRRVAQQWVDAFVRRNTAELPPLQEEEHMVLVSQTLKERALYLALTEQQCEPASGEPEEIQAARQSTRGLLKICSHFAPSTAADMLTADGECERVLAQRRGEVDHTVAEMRPLVNRAVLLVQQVRHFEPHFCKIPDPANYHLIKQGSRAEIAARVGALGGSSAGTKAHLLKRLFELAQADGVDEVSKDAALRADFDPELSGATPVTPALSGTAWLALEAAASTAEVCVASSAADDGRATLQAIFKESFAAVGSSIPARCAKLCAQLGMPGADDSTGGEALRAWCNQEGNGDQLRRVVNCWKSELQKVSARTLDVERALTAKLRSLRFFERTLQAQMTSDFCCPVCSATDVSVECRAILPCAHVGCQTCLAAYVEKHLACPVCRATCRPADVMRIDSSGSRPIEDGGDESAQRFAKYGSKIRALVERVRAIQRTDAKCKAICFVQWEDLKSKISSALKEFGVDHVVLEGSVWARRSALINFQYEADGPRLMLLSLEESASGTNLTAANHVLIVHPMEATSREEAVAFEMQAIGRVRRPGQLRKIHIWRFVTTGTIEQSITEDHQRDLWQRYTEGLQCSQAERPTGHMDVLDLPSDVEHEEAARIGPGGASTEAAMDVDGEPLAWGEESTDEWAATGNPGPALKTRITKRDLDAAGIPAETQAYLERFEDAATQAYLADPEMDCPAATQAYVPGSLPSPSHGRSGIPGVSEGVLDVEGEVATQLYADDWNM